MGKILDFQGFEFFFIIMIILNPLQNPLRIFRVINCTYKHAPSEQLGAFLLEHNYLTFNFYCPIILLQRGWLYAIQVVEQKILGGQTFFNYEPLSKLHIIKKQNKWEHLLLSSTQIELSFQEYKHSNALCGEHGAYQLII